MVKCNKCLPTFFADFWHVNDGWILCLLVELCTVRVLELQDASAVLYHHALKAETNTQQRFSTAPRPSSTVNHPFYTSCAKASWYDNTICLVQHRPCSFKPIRRAILAVLLQVGRFHPRQHQVSMRSNRCMPQRFDDAQVSILQPSVFPDDGYRHRLREVIHLDEMQVGGKQKMRRQDALLYRS